MGVLDPNVCRSVLKSTLSAIPGVGQVHAYRRIARNEAEVRNRFFDPTSGKINGWMISFAPNNAAKSERQTGFSQIGMPGGGSVLTTFAFQIEAYYGLDDANDSEEAFANLIWLVAQTINSYGALNIPDLSLQGPCDIAMCSYANLVNKFLTHYGRLALTLEGRTL